MKVWSYLERLLSVDLNANFSEVTALKTKVDALTPVGSVLYFDDLNGVNVVDTNYWSALNGQVISDVLSVYNGKTLPDLSGRYIVGYGEDGDTTINTSMWSAAAVGNVYNQVNLQHSHTSNSHTHSVTTNNHQHSNGTIRACIRLNAEGYDGIEVRQSVGNDNWQSNAGDDIGSPKGNWKNNYTSVETVGVTGWGGSETVNAGYASVTTNNSLSGIQSIQPRSIRMRAYLRKR